MEPSQHLPFTITFAFRFLYFLCMFMLLLRFNNTKLKAQKLVSRILPNLLITIGGFAIYEGAISLFALCHDRFISTLIFQFFIICTMSLFIGYISYLDAISQEKEKELNQLRIESLENRYNALTSQINPHFFFNSLNSISSLVRKKDEQRTLNYISQLSFIFRYILQSGKRGLVPLSEELAMAEAFRSVMEVRYAHKLRFIVNVSEEDQHRTIPVLSLLPLLENITVHNVIDSDHLMTITISSTANHEVAVSNPVFAKLERPDTNGIGLKNLQNRFKLLKNADIRYGIANNEDNTQTFTVYLPLK